MWLRRLRRDLPSWQTHYTSDDYTDMTWFAPTVRFYVGRAVLKAPPGFAYPEWALNALGGLRQQGKAESAMNALKSMTKQTARVRRGGEHEGSGLVVDHLPSRGSAFAAPHRQRRQHQRYRRLCRRHENPARA